jgi:hypothetical protein
MARPTACAYGAAISRLTAYASAAATHFAQLGPLAATPMRNIRAGSGEAPPGVIRIEE